MTQFIAHFKPEHFYPVPEGTILRYLAHHFNKDTQRWDVLMEVIGETPKDLRNKMPKVVFVKE